MLFLFLGFIEFRHARIGVIGASCAKVLVSFAHIAIRETGFFTKQLIDNFMQVIHVARKRVATDQMAWSQRMILVVCLQIGSAIFARQHVLQAQHERAIVAFVCCSGMNGIVETHGVQIMPHGRSPYGG